MKKKKMFTGLTILGVVLLLGCGGGGSSSSGSSGPSPPSACAGVWGSVPCGHLEGVGFQFVYNTSGCESYDFYYQQHGSGLVCLHPSSPVMFGSCGGGGVIEAVILAKWPNESSYDILVARAGTWPPFGQWTVTISDPCAVQTLNFN